MHMFHLQLMPLFQAMQVLRHQTSIKNLIVQITKFLTIITLVTLSAVVMVTVIVYQFPMPLLPSTLTALYLSQIQAIIILELMLVGIQVTSHLQGHHCPVILELDCHRQIWMNQRIQDQILQLLPQ